MTEPRQSGTCKTFNSTKGFGFITDNYGGEELFVHYSAIHGDGFKTLGPGELVEYDIEIDEMGRKKAINVSGPQGSKVVGETRPRRPLNNYNDDRRIRGNSNYGSGGNSNFGSGGNRDYGSSGENRDYGSGGTRDYGSGGTRDYGSGGNRDYGSGGKRYYNSGGSRGHAAGGHGQEGQFNNYPEYHENGQENAGNLRGSDFRYNNYNENFQY